MRAMKEAEKKLKNVKLQYTRPDETIFFEDVAGIGDAKASGTHVSFHFYICKHSVCKSLPALRRYILGQR